MLNFNVAPYFDDFDPNKNYHRILFRPGRAVQARELTQSQTILQDQITKFADHIFKQNTPVKGGQVTINTKSKYIKLNATFNGINVTASDFLNTVITDSTGTISAMVIATEEATGGDPPTLFVTYFSGREFTNGSVVLAAKTGATAQAAPAGATGQAVTASISEGVFYIVNGYTFSSVVNQDGSNSRYSIGNFVAVQPQTIVVSKYSTIPTKRVGLTISEFITDYITDSSLLDPAVGATNYQAPGAERYSITLTLDTKDTVLGGDQSFIELVRLTNGQIQRLVDGTVYGVIDDYFAKRTFDTNGDFVVNDFRLVPRANTGNAANYQVQVGPGTAYVKGYRVESTLDTILEAPRARTTETVLNNAVSIDYGSYMYVNGANGVFDIGAVVPVDFHCINAAASIVTTNTTTYNATKVGSGFIRSLSYDTNTSDANTQTYVYKAFVSNIVNNSLSSNVATATISTFTPFDLTGSFSAANTAYDGVTVSIDSGKSAGDVREVLSYNGLTKTFTVKVPFTLIPDTTSKFTIRFSTVDTETVVHPTSTNTFDAFMGIDPKSKVGNLSIGDTTLFNSLTPEMLFNVGFPYCSTLVNTSYSTEKVSRGVAFTTTAGGVSGAFTLPSGMTFFGTGGTTQSSDIIKQNYQVVVTAKGSSAFNVGDVVNFTSTNTISLDAGKGTATFFVAGSTSATFTATIIAKVFVSNADSTSLTLKAKNLTLANTTQVFLSGTAVGSVQVNTSAAQVYIPAANVVTGGAKQSLFMSDVKKIVKIIDTGAAGTAATNAMLTNSTFDVTQNYLFDSGQNDLYYGYASIALRPGAPRAKGNLLVLFDYYAHSGGDGYFSVNSYRAAIDGGVSSSAEAYASIPQYISKGGTIYELKECVDFRLSVINAQATETFRFATAITTTNASGAYIPVDLTTFISDYTHYLGRKDTLVLSKDKSFQLIQGKPSNTPEFPGAPEGCLLMANITLDPYTAFLPDEISRSLPNLSVEKVQHKRWAMSDISDLQTRVNNIEYYTSLSLLEKQAQTLQVPDVNGLNRFKNGILVDNFTGYSSADTGNADYAAKIDKRNTVFTASDHVVNVKLEPKDAFRALGQLSQAAQDAGGYKYHSTTGGATGIITLPYTTANLVTQKIASNTVSLNPFGVSIAEGILDINPPMDNWVSTTKDPDLVFVDPNLTIFQQGSTMNQLSATDWQTVTGTAISSASRSGRTVTVATYASQVQQTISGFYDKVNSLSANFLTDISVQPYIRSQELIVKARGMKVNTPVSVYFDNVKVNKYMIAPNIVQLTGVTGTFLEGDIVGYFSGGIFTPTARVVSVTKIDATTVRLYLTSDNSSTIYTNNNVLQSAAFDATGVYVGSLASGTLSNLATQTLSMSGKIAGFSGGTTTNLNGGGINVSGVTSITLDAKASSVNNFYNGGSITLTTYNQVKTTRRVVVGQTQVFTWTGDDGYWSWQDVMGDVDFYDNITTRYTASITAYNGTTKVATLDTAVNVSSGSNSLAGAAAIPVASTYTITGTNYLVTQAIASVGPSMLSTDEQGNFSAIFAVPSSTFKTGDRMLRVDNRTSDTDPDSATTFAQGVFTASSLATKSQTLNFGASVSAAAKATVFTSQARRDNIMISAYSYTVDPVAQSFIIDPATYTNGAFLKSIKVFFKGKPSEANAVPVKLFITDTTNGYPNGVALDHSVVIKTASEINISDTPHYLDETTYTEFTFECPVYIRAGNLYAFILQSTSPDYVIWVASQNAVAVSSTVKVLPTDPTPTDITKIGGSPYVGALFESQNGITWNADQTKNMMFTIENCVFNVGAAPVVQYVVPKKIPLRKNLTGAIDYYNNANTVSDLTGLFYGRDVRSDAYNVTVTDFVPTNTNISYTYTPTLLSNYTVDDTKNVTPGKFGTSMPTHITLDDGKGPRVLDANSVASFTLSASLSSTNQYVSPVISGDGTSLYNIKYNINNLGLANANIIVTNPGSGYSNANAVVTISAPTGLGGTQATATPNVVGGIIDSIFITNSGSGYVTTPTITITGANTTQASANVFGETSAKGGNGFVRYITKKVVLTPENDSADLRVIYSAFKPRGTNIYVYYKILNRNDTSAFEDQSWQLMTDVGQNTGAYSLTREDIREFSAAPGTNGVADNTIKYSSTNGQTYTKFGSFAIKIVLSTSDTTKVPEISDLRVLALPSGTGL